jgi:hypothetical protein
VVLPAAGTGVVVLPAVTVGDKTGADVLLVIVAGTDPGATVLDAGKPDMISNVLTVLKA